MIKRIIIAMISKPDIAIVLQHYGIDVIDKHGWVPCKCVIHDDSHASAAYNLDTQGYNCLVCQVIGDVYTLVQAKEGISFTDAKRKAAQITNGRSRKILQVSNATGSLLPSGTRNNKERRKYVPSWKRL